MPGIDYAKLRSTVGIEVVLDMIKFKATETRGDELRGPCPIHGSTSPRSRSFSVNVRKNAFHCFGCGAKGNQLELLMATSKLPLFQAAQSLCEHAGIDAPQIRPW